MINKKDALEAAKQLDQKDSLAEFRSRFLIPKTSDGRDYIYLCGNSLGLQSKGIRSIIEQELSDWEAFGVHGHHDAQRPWYKYHEFLTEPMAAVLGAKPLETVIMNTLTVNVHLMLVSFYQPKPSKFKILIEYSSFPSDRYAVESQIRFHGYDPKEALIILEPKLGKDYVSRQQMDEVFAREGDQIALALIGSVNYYTGQAYPIAYLTQLAHAHNCKIGFDLAHGAGNLLLNLHEDGPDFAVWCGYKYLNGGPGTLAGCFVHERHANNSDLPRFAGWWGHDKSKRFKMEPKFEYIPGAEGWQLSNPPILPMACLLESLQIFQKAGMKAIREKNLAMGSLLLQWIKELLHPNLKILTPENPEERGAQLSIRLKDANKQIFQNICSAGVIADWREPDVIRIAPVALYNNFTDIANFMDIFQTALYEKG